MYSYIYQLLRRQQQAKAEKKMFSLKIKKEDENLRAKF